MSGNPDSQDDATLQAILADCLERLQRGESIDRHEIRWRHPQYADSVCEFLDNQKLFREAFRDAGSVAPPWGVGATVATGASSIPATASVGDRLRYIGEYEIIEEIAHGGMGVVFKARQHRLGREVALK